MESNNKIKMNIGNIYFFFIYGLPGCGKSTFFKMFLTEINSRKDKERYNIYIISNDKIRKKLMNNYKRENPNLTLDECF